MKNVIKYCDFHNRECIECHECDYCELDETKLCDNCMKCVDMPTESYKEILIDEIILDKKSE